MALRGSAPLLSVYGDGEIVRARAQVIIRTNYDPGRNEARANVGQYRRLCTSPSTDEAFATFFLATRNNIMSKHILLASKVIQNDFPPSSKPGQRSTNIDHGAVINQ